MISPLLNFLKLRKLETTVRLEKNVEPADGESAALTSIAISLRRLADHFASVPYDRYQEFVHIGMLSALSEQHASKSYFEKDHALADISKMLREYFSEPK